MSNYKWQSIDTAPEDGSQFLVYVAKSEESEAYCFGPVSRDCYDGWYDDVNGVQCSELPGATHWMPLPPPPVQEVTDEDAPLDAYSDLELLKLCAERIMEIGGYMPAPNPYTPILIMLAQALQKHVIKQRNEAANRSRR